MKYISERQKSLPIPISPPVMRLSWVRDLLLELKLGTPKILDPFTGNGEILLASCMLDCPYIGYAKEILDNYAEVIATFGDFNKHIVHANKKEYPDIAERLMQMLF